MNPVNATSLFVSATRSVLQCDPRDPRALAELCKLLPFFRQSLSCLVCGEWGFYLSQYIYTSWFSVTEKNIHFLFSTETLT